METAVEYADLLKNRENTYLFLADIYKKEITEEFYEKITGYHFNCDEDVPLRDGYSMIKRFLDEKTDDAVTALAVDYARIFLGAGIVEKDRSAAPYESVYTSAERLVMQAARDSVLSLYRKNSVGCSLNVPEDHISLEFEFMAYLCGKASAELSGGVSEAFLQTMKEQANFLNNHISRWVPAFCDDVESFSGTSFYKGVASVTRDFIDMDAQLVSEIIAEVN